MLHFTSEEKLLKFAIREAILKNIKNLEDSFEGNNAIDSKDSINLLRNKILDLRKYYKKTFNVEINIITDKEEKTDFGVFNYS